ncbi:MAG: hypothetical protein HQK93_10610, partial [Nitrospirae bacterium]|nr:hypothetical protein [Nitrospirota bacterium]
MIKLFNKMKITAVMIIFIMSLTSIVMAEDINAINKMSNNQAGLAFNISSVSYLYNNDYVGIPTYNSFGRPIYNVSRHGFDQVYYGENLMLLMRYKDGKSITFTAGVFGGLINGENDLYAPLMPVASFHYEPDNNFYLTFGTLDRGTHNMLDAIFDDTLYYPKPSKEATLFRRLPLINSSEVPKPLENGFEIYFGYLRPLTYQGWVNWNYVNTALDRESFDAASIFLLDLKSQIGLVLNGDWRYIHRGGQLYHNGTLMDGHVFNAGLSFYPTFIPNAKISANQLWSHDIANRYDPSKTLNGNGQEARLEYNLYGFNLSTTYWNGRKFYTE